MTGRIKEIVKGKNRKLWKINELKEELLEWAYRHNLEAEEKGAGKDGVMLGKVGDQAQVQLTAPMVDPAAAAAAWQGWGCGWDQRGGAYGADWSLGGSATEGWEDE